MKTLIWGLLLLANLAFSNDLVVDSFHKNFKIKRNEAGQAIAIQARLVSTKFDLKKYVESVKNELKAEQVFLREKNAQAQAEIENFIQSLEIDDKTEEDVAYVIREAFNGLATADIEETFKEIENSDFFSEFGNRLRAAFQSLDFTIISKMDDPRFFYQQRVTYQVVTWALDWAKKRFSQIPILNTVSYVIVKIEKLIREQRTFYQNMLLYYLDNVDHAKLGLTKAEADHLFSSIFESRIPWSNIWESNAAAENWNRFGTDKFYTSVRTANMRYRDLAWNFRSLNGKLNFAFAEVTGEKGKMIINLVDNKHMFSMQPAVAYYYDQPQKIMRERMLMNLAQVAVSFITIPDGLKSMFNNFVNSFFEKQKLTEGSLYAYLDMNGQSTQARTVVLGAINPFLILY